MKLSPREASRKEAFNGAGSNLLYRLKQDPFYSFIVTRVCSYHTVGLPVPTGGFYYSEINKICD